MDLTAFNTGDFAVSHRGGIVENRHLVHAAVVDATGKILYCLGDPSRMTLIRSAAKPVQAIPAIESGAIEKFGFEDADLALMCGSHNSEQRHVERAKSMLAKLQVEESELQCCGHTPFSPVVAKAWTKSGFKPTPACAACSGNHIGVMAAAKALGADVGGYHTLDHPVQARIRSAMDDLAGLGPDEVKWALDGCNMYSPAAPLRSLALAYAAFPQAVEDVTGGNGSVSRRTQAMAQIYNAMTRYPENIAGEGGFCSALNATYGGALIGKSGADGCYAIGVRESEDTRLLGAQGAVGIALKIEDGNYEVMKAVAVEILEQLHIGTEEIRQRLDQFHRGEVRTTAGIVTGRLSFPFKLRVVA
ncbi:thermolabile L-asparaginase [Xylaria intraflava]|nr:thermolabile L-asparaginase [Xylaria intraflava]